MTIEIRCLENLPNFILPNAILPNALLPAAMKPSPPFYPMPFLIYPIAKIIWNDYLIDYIIKWSLRHNMKLSQPNMGL